MRLRQVKIGFGRWLVRIVVGYVPVVCDSLMYNVSGICFTCTLWSFPLSLDSHSRRAASLSLKNIV